MQLIFFTDLDGSLLNHEDYSFDEALSSLDLIRRYGIPLIMTTSKTRKEVEPIQREMGIREPMIVENGGGIHIPLGYRNWTVDHGERIGDYAVIRLGAPYSVIRGFMERARRRFPIRGFGDMAPTEIAERTGLPIEKAALAGEREFTEPFILSRPDEIDPLRIMAEAEGFTVTQGGRFHHLMGAGQDKGKAVRISIDLFRRNGDTPLTTVGLGDSENDVAMLRQVDIPVLIPRPGKGHLDLQLPGLIRADETGAKGWNGAVLHLLNERMTHAAEKQ